MSNFNDFEKYNHGNAGNNGRYSNVDNTMSTRNSFYNDEVVGIGTWILVLIATAIPFLNLIVLLFLAFGASNENLKNYGKAALIILGIVLLFTFMLRGCASIY